MSKDYGESKIVVPRFSEEAGFYTTRKRSQMMSRIKGRNSKPELRFRKALWARNIRFRIHDKSLPGKPDVSIKKYRLAVFIDGDFWHGKDWPKKREKIKTNRAFWIPKIERNMQKDLEVNELLREKGYRVFRFWEEDIKTDLDRCVSDVYGYIISYPFFSEKSL